MTSPGQRRTLDAVGTLLLVGVLAVGVVTAQEPLGRGVALAPEEAPVSESVALETVEFNRELAGFLRANDKITLVDLESGFDPEVLTFDGVHPTEAGSLWMANRWLEALATAGMVTPGADLSVMPVGDSITADAYRYEVWAGLTQRGVNVDLTGDSSGPPLVETPAVAGKEFDDDHSGHDGATSVDLVKRLPMSAEDPDVILLHVGTNDLVWREESPRILARDAAALALNLGQAHPASHVFVARIIPYHRVAGDFLRTLEQGPNND